MVDVEAVKAKKFKVVLDAVNSTGGISLPPLLEKIRLRSREIILQNQTDNFRTIQNL